MHHCTLKPAIGLSFTGLQYVREWIDRLKPTKTTNQVRWTLLVHPSQYDFAIGLVINYHGPHHISVFECDFPSEGLWVAVDEFGNSFSSNP